MSKRVQHTVKPITPADAALISKISQPFLWLCLHTVSSGSEFVLKPSTLCHPCWFVNAEFQPCLEW